MVKSRARSTRSILVFLLPLTIAAMGSDSLAVTGAGTDLVVDAALLPPETRYAASVSVASESVRRLEPRGQSEPGTPVAEALVLASYARSVSLRSESVHRWETRRRLTSPDPAQPEDTRDPGDSEWSVVIGAEARLFFESPAFASQENNDASVFFTSEYSHYWDDDRQSFTIVPFARLDSADSERTHFDLREAVWRKRTDEWELGIGVDRVFWGVTESQHLVDIVNQTDLVENIDGEDKLGQPMFHLTLMRDWGDLELFALPWSRQRTFPGPDGRLRLNPPVDSDAAQYESSSEEARVDLAIRWSDVIGPWDIGLSHFYGTTRDPAFFMSSDPGPPRLIPFYSIINQTGLDLQLTLGSWAWKLESVYRTGQGDDWLAATGGFEYTLTGVMSSASDLGLLLEYLYADDRVNVPTPFPDDFFLGLRFDLNDPQGTNVLAGLYQSRDDDGRLWNVEARRRIGHDWRVDLELRIWNDYPPDNVQFFIQKDDYLGITLSRYF